MGQKQRSIDATKKDAQDGLKQEECASGMGQMSRINESHAAEKGAKIKLKLEECAGGMGQMQWPDDAIKKDAQSLLREEECAEGMELRSSIENYAERKDARI